MQGYQSLHDFGHFHLSKLLTIIMLSSLPNISSEDIPEHSVHSINIETREIPSLYFFSAQSDPGNRK